MNAIRLIVLWGVAVFLHAARGSAADLPPEQPLWDQRPQVDVVRYTVDEQIVTHDPMAGSPSQSNRVFRYVARPTYSLHRPDHPNGVGLVICPGGGYHDVWLDREGHDLAIWLKGRGVTSLVLKYRTNSGKDNSRPFAWSEYLPAVQADARQAIRVLRSKADELGLDRKKIGISGFSAGGHLALMAALVAEPHALAHDVRGTPDFAGLFYPWLRNDIQAWINDRRRSASAATRVCPMFLMNARDDTLTPANACVDLYATLLQTGVDAELHVFGQGAHGFDLGTGRGHSAALWPASFVAWLRDTEFIVED